jgi:hypothetical protein
MHRKLYARAMARNGTEAGEERQKAKKSRRFRRL